MRKKHQILIAGLGGTTVFLALMLFGLKQNPNFTTSVLVGKPAPQFSGPLLSGVPFTFPSTLTQQPAHWVIVNFWSASCPICRHEAPALQDFYHSVSQQDGGNPQLLTVNIGDNPAVVRQWEQETGTQLPVVLDKEGTIAIDYGVTGTPETFFIDPQGIVRYRIAGAVDKNRLVQFTAWLAAHPQASEEAGTQALGQLPD